MLSSFRLTFLLTFSIIFIFLCFLGVQAAPLPPEIMESLKVVEVLEINVRNLDVIWDLRQNQHPNRADIVDLRVDNSKLSSELNLVLQNWVRSGKGIILYSCNFAKFFPDIEVQHYATSSSGYGKPNTVATSISDSHPVITGVEKIYFNGDNDYFSITRKANSAILPIMEISGGKVVVAVSDFGRGRVVCFTNDDNWNMSIFDSIDQYDNHRFKINLDQWLSGNPVPGLLGVGGVTGGKSTVVATKPNSELYDTVYLKNGDVLSGTVLNQDFVISTSYGDVPLKIGEIAQIILEGETGQGPGNIEQLILRIGDKLSGIVNSAKISIELASGPEISLEKDKIASITFKIR